MKRHPNVPNRLLKITCVSNSGSAHDTGDKSRVPVPSPTPIFALPKVLAQPLKVFRPGTVWQVAGNHISGLFQRVKAFVNMRAHEPDNLGDTCSVHVRRNVDKCNRFKRIACQHACGNYGCKSSKRSTDHMRSRAITRHAFTNLNKV